MPLSKITTLDMEIAVARFFGFRKNVIVPNLGYGMMMNNNTAMHECDLFILTRSGYGYEVEIKISKTDLLKDKDKPHKHEDERIKYLYFAIPNYLLEHKNHIPERAGIISVMLHENGQFCTTVIRKPRKNSSYVFNDKEQFNIARLGAMRTWGFKRNLQYEGKN